MTLQVGITGGIGAGKSVVTRIFKVLGVPVYDADSHARTLMNSDAVLIRQIKEAFGDAAYLVSGEIDRAYLSKTVFASRQKTEKINSLVHPLVAEDYAAWLKQNHKATYVVKEAALLFESGSNKTLDKIITVTAPEALRIKRVLFRDPHRTMEGVLKIIATQMPEDEKIANADIVINNDETNLLVPQVLKLHDEFIGRKN